MKHEKKEQILCGSNFSLKSDIIYSEYISKEEFIIQNTKNKQIIFEEKNFVLYKQQNLNCLRMQLFSVII
jgi:hypothetical protein